MSENLTLKLTKLFFNKKDLCNILIILGEILLGVIPYLWMSGFDTAMQYILAYY